MVLPEFVMLLSGNAFSKSVRFSVTSSVHCFFFRSTVSQHWAGTLLLNSNLPVDKKRWLDTSSTTSSKKKLPKHHHICSIFTLASPLFSNSSNITCHSLAMRSPSTSHSSPTRRAVQARLPNPVQERRRQSVVGSVASDPWSKWVSLGYTTLWYSLLYPGPL